jgi:hypothetical protein
VVKPILACKDPYETAKIFQEAGWQIEFSQPLESGDPLVSVSLSDNSILLGITHGYVREEQISYIGCGVVFYITVPKDEFRQIYDNHKKLEPTSIELQLWGDYTFEVMIGGFKFMIASE